MNTHDWQAMVREVTQQILHSDRFSKAELQLGPLSQEQAEIPNRPGILGDQGVIPTGVEGNDAARAYPPFEGSVNGNRRRLAFRARNIGTIRFTWSPLA
jgi:hypothetical protein